MQWARQCKDKKIDVVFVVDGSENANFHRSKSKVVNLLKPLEPNSFQHQLKIHFVQFGGNKKFKADLRQYTVCSRTNTTGCDTFKEFTTKLLKVKKVKGEPYWADAFQMVTETLRMRAGSIKVLVTIMGDKINDINDAEGFIKVVDNLKRFEAFDVEFKFCYK